MLQSEDQLVTMSRYAKHFCGAVHMEQLYCVV